MVDDGADDGRQPTREPRAQRRPGSEQNSPLQMCGTVPMKTRYTVEELCANESSPTTAQKEAHQCAQVWSWSRAPVSHLVPERHTRQIVFFSKDFRRIGRKLKTEVFLGNDFIPRAIDSRLLCSGALLAGPRTRGQQARSSFAGPGVSRYPGGAAQDSMVVDVRRRLKAAKPVLARSRELSAYGVMTTVRDACSVAITRPVRLPRRRLCRQQAAQTPDRCR